MFLDLDSCFHTYAAVDYFEIAYSYSHEIEDRRIVC